jgi:hypothetical protein
MGGCYERPAVARDRNIRFVCVATVNFPQQTADESQDGDPDSLTA